MLQGFNLSRQQASEPVGGTYPAASLAARAAPVDCFDTTLQFTLHPETFSYAIPTDWWQDGPQRFGFHGGERCGSQPLAGPSPVGR